MRTATLYLRLIGAQMRSQMQYRTSFLLDLAATFLGSFVDFVGLAAVFGRFDSIAGWTLWEVGFLYGLVGTSFALMDLLWGGFDYDLVSARIRRGDLDQMLLRPLSLPLQLLGSEFALRRLGRIAQAVLVLTVSIAQLDITWTAAKLLYLPVVIASGFAFFAAIYVVGSTVCFWTIERLEAFNLFSYGGTEMLSKPMHIYHPWMQRFFTFIVPAALIVFYPGLFFLGRPDPTGMPAFMPFLAPAAGFTFLALSFAFWNYGVRHYQSTGT